LKVFLISISHFVKILELRKIVKFHEKRVQKKEKGKRFGPTDPPKVFMIWTRWMQLGQDTTGPPAAHPAQSKTPLTGAYVTVLVHRATLCQDKGPQGTRPLAATRCFCCRRLFECLEGFPFEKKSSNESVNVLFLTF